jgi:hypothetical protein
MARTALLVIDMLSAYGPFPTAARGGAGGRHAGLADAALELMERNMRAEICRADEVEF